MRLGVENRPCPCDVYGIVVILRAENKTTGIMTAVQIHAELFRTMGEIADDEGLMMKLLKYAKKLAAKKNDPTLMTKEEFFARVDEAKKEPSKRFANVAELDQYIRSL